MGCLSCTIQSFVSLVAWLHSILQPCKANELLWMSLRQWLWAGHFMRQAFDSEIWKRHQSAYSTTELARSVHYSQLILQLSWMQSSTVMVSSWVQAHSAPTHSHHQESHNMWSSDEPQWNQKLPSISLFPASGVLSKYHCSSAVTSLEILQMLKFSAGSSLCKSMALEPSSQLFQLYHGCTKVCRQHGHGAA
jgi:hypothetical protein